MLHAGDAERHRQVRRLANDKSNAFLGVGSESLEADRDLVNAERQEQGAEAAVGIGCDLTSEIGAGIDERDRRPGQAAAGLVGNSSFDDASDCLRLRAGERRSEEQRSESKYGYRTSHSHLHRRGFAWDD